jgi:ketosteroid isomerase-like protein
MSAAILGYAILSPAVHAQQPAAARAAIDAANKQFIAAGAKGDAAGIASVYSEDANAFPPNEPIVKGRAAIQKMWQGAIDMGVAKIDLTTTEVEADGKLAYESGTYAMLDKAGKALDRGKYCVVWKNVNGKWMLHRDIWSTDLPAPAPKAPGATPDR